MGTKEKEAEFKLKKEIEAGEFAAGQIEKSKTNLMETYNIIKRDRVMAYALASMYLFNIYFFATMISDEFTKIPPDKTAGYGVTISFGLMCVLVYMQISSVIIPSYVSGNMVLEEIEKCDRLSSQLKSQLEKKNAELQGCYRDVCI